MCKTKKKIILKYFENCLKNSCKCPIYNEKDFQKYILKEKFLKNTNNLNLPNHYFLGNHTWVKYEGKIPCNAIVGCRDLNENLTYIARVYYNNSITPAICKQYKSKTYKANFPYGCKENKINEFEILCGPAIKWVLVPSSITDLKFPIGKEDGEILYCGRVKIFNNYFIGKIKPMHNCLYICLFGKEICVKRNYEIMCYDKDAENKLSKSISTIENFWLNTMYNPNSSYVKNVLKKRFERNQRQFNRECKP